MVENSQGDWSWSGDSVRGKYDPQTSSDLTEGGRIVEQLDNGLLVDGDRVIGYIFAFAGHGAYAPTGRVGELTREQIDRHNAALGRLELGEMEKTGRAILYRTKREIAPGLTNTFAGNWSGGWKFRCYYTRTGRHNIAGKRLDVWFMAFGHVWHGVNIGDNDILRCKRTKRTHR